MKKKIVIALGGNALGKNLYEQMEAVKNTAKAIVDLIEEGHEVIISHGNGPQVGLINLAMEEQYKNGGNSSRTPMSVCVAMSQGYIGYDLQSLIREELLNRNINKPVATIITQVTVDGNDRAFKNPTKPIGSFMSKEEADKLIAKGENVVEDSGRGYRRVVASPKPVSIVEIDTIKTLVDAGQVVIACGGGGIPVTEEGNHLKGVSAVIDKDFASAQLAKLVDADCLIILTAVEKVAINFGKDNEEWLCDISLEQAEEYVKQGHFAPGSMLPKVQAAMEFASSQENRYALITLLEKAKEGIAGNTGTVIR
ncbi:carbamate kinase [Clostridium sediminicola]|uniref:carbamate kinase n=1 Tax=Clostridium sediminicola TaxID=3114879 RepID=UPI0031F1D810